MQFLLLSAVCFVIFGQVKMTLATNAQGNSSVVHPELVELKEQVEALGENLKSDLVALRGGQNLLIHTLYGLINQLASYGNSTAEDCDLKELWVSSVPGFSSEKGGWWAASKVIGPADVYPRYGDIPGAWTPKPLTDNDYIELAFESALYIREVLIYETYHAGAVKTVEFRNPEGNWDVQARFTPKVITQSKIFSVDTRNSAYRTNQIKLTLDCTVAPTWVEIDAVKIKGTKDACHEPMTTPWLG